MKFEQSNKCKVTIIVLPESSMMCVASVLEPLRAANRVSGEELYAWSTSSFSGGAVPLSCDVLFNVSEKFCPTMRGKLACYSRRLQSAKRM